MRERWENCQSVVFDEIPTESVICRAFFKMSTVRQHVQQESLVRDVLTMFESVSGLIFKLKEQDTAVKNLLSNRDVLAVLLTAYFKRT